MLTVFLFIQNALEMHWLGSIYLAIQVKRKKSLIFSLKTEKTQKQKTNKKIRGDIILHLIHEFVLNPLSKLKILSA